jgi:hypothetical protein
MSQSFGTASNLDGVSYGDSTFVAVGTDGVILTSPDGATWTSQASGTTNTLTGVSFGNFAFVAVGTGGTVLASPDGKNWVSESSGTTSDLSGVCYGNSSGTFVAVGSTGAIIQASVSGQPGQTPSPAPVITPGEQLAVFTIGQSSFFLDGQSYNTDAAPFISSGRTLVPVRYLAEALGAQTNWDATNQKVSVIKGSTTIVLTINSTTITTNGTTGQLDAAPLLVNGRTYLPARYIAEALGYTVQWNATAQAVNIVGNQ